MGTIFDVAHYILSKTGPLTTMKLQKLCYYAQAWSLAWDEQPLFNEDFQAWANGPVCPSLFHAHRGRFVVSSFDIPSTTELCDSDKDTIDEVIAYYGDKDPDWLSELTHKERPWREARAKAHARPGDFCSVVITKESMMDYYSGL